MTETAPHPERDRVLLALTGGFAGLFMWFLLLKLPDMLGETRLLLLVVSFFGGFFSVLLAALGPLRPVRAALVAVSVAAVAALLLVWASLRHDRFPAFLATGHVVVAYLFLLCLPVPFLIAAARPDQRWAAYPALFDHAWRLVVRYLVAWAFTGLFWGLVLLSDAVLKIVGLDIIEQALEIAPVPWILTGLALGLGLAVVHDLRAYLSPDLALRLLRLLLPLVLAVSAVFLVAALLRGLSGLFGGISSAAVLMAMAATAVTLITAVVDAGPGQAASSRILTLSARAMALILPLLGGLAAWAIWLRVAQYGWTPDRLAAAVSALVVLAYGACYGGAVLLGRGWMGRIRRANIAMALAMIGLAAAWLTPVLNAERISAGSQLARFEQGRVAADRLDLWSIGREWGRAGQEALARLSDPANPRAGELAPPLARLAASQSRWQWQQARENDMPGADLEAFLALLELRPQGAQLPENAFLEGDWVAQWLAGCRRRTPAGNPGCVALVGDFLPDNPGQEVAVIYLESRDRARAEGWAPGGQYLRTIAPEGDALPAAVIDRLLAGQGVVANPPQVFLLIGEKLLTLPEN